MSGGAQEHGSCPGDGSGAAQAGSDSLMLRDGFQASVVQRGVSPAATRRAPGRAPDVVPWSWRASTSAPSLCLCALIDENTPEFSLVGCSGRLLGRTIGVRSCVLKKEIFHLFLISF